MNGVYAVDKPGTLQACMVHRQRLNRMSWTHVSSVRYTKQLCDVRAVFLPFRVRCIQQSAETRRWTGPLSELQGWRSLAVGTNHRNEGTPPGRALRCRPSSPLMEFEPRRRSSPARWRVLCACARRRGGALGSGPWSRGAAAGARSRVRAGGSRVRVGRCLRAIPIADGPARCEQPSG